MADANEIAFARALIRDSLVALRWAASDEGTDNEGEPLVAPALKPALAEAVEEVDQRAFAQALHILEGKDPDFPPERVADALRSVGWTGASLAFKERALDEAGRQEVMEAVEGAGPKPRGRIWRKFMKVLNAALGSLSIIPGVEQIKQLKDFAEGATSG